MKKLVIILTVLASISFGVNAQSKKAFELNFTDPQSVVNAIFYAAQSKDFAIMQCLADPYGEEDGDVKYLSSISQVAKQAKDSETNNNKKVDEFVSMFKTGKINGEVTYKKQSGVEYANVPFWFNHPGGERRSNETMVLVKRYGNWYLYSF
ncbi:MAG: hypothetical protein N4A72_10565 [Bacteroidales bacterium]|jgi:hypothetical protein|nr:hypothetical protein [Bacteroidales bacterium]